MNKATQENLLKLVKDNYEAIASEFDETRKKYLWPELAKLTDSVKNGDRVLDAGCGNGRLTSAFFKKNVRYLGIDSSTTLIELAKINLKAENFQFSIFNFQFMVGNLLELNKLAIGQFDYIFCVAVLLHLPGRELQLKVLEQLKAKLAPGGKIILINWNLWSQPKYRSLIFKFAWQKLLGQNPMDLGDITFDWKRGLESRRYYHAFTKRELKQLARSAGLSIEKLYSDKFNYYLILNSGR